MQESEQQTYLYAYRLLVGKGISVVFMIILGCMTNTVLVMGLFALAFIPLRQNAGGFHFESPELCIGFSALLAGAIAAGVKYMSYLVTPNVWMGMELVSVILIWKYSPVESVHKKLDQAEKHTYARRCRRILVIESIVFLVAVVLQLEMVSIMIPVVHFVVAWGLVMELMKGNS